MKKPGIRPPAQSGEPAPAAGNRSEGIPVLVEGTMAPVAPATPDIDGARGRSRLTQTERPLPTPMNIDPKSTLVSYEIDPLALVVPASTEKELAALADSIVAHGQMQPAVLRDGRILDGRSRDIVCKRLGRPLLTTPLPEGVNPVEYVVAANLHRRQLSAAQRAVVAAKLIPFYSAEAAKRKQVLSGTRANVDGSQPQVTEIVPGPDQCGEAREKAAKSTGSNPKYVSDLLKILREAPELFKEVESAAMSIPKAMRMLEKQREQRDEKQGSPVRDAFLVVLWDDAQTPPTRAPEKSYGAKTYPNIAFFRFYAAGETNIESASKHGLTHVALFVVPVERGALIKDKEGRSFCRASCRLLTLSIRGAVPELATVPEQIIEDGFEGVVRMIESLFPDLMMVISSARHEAPPGWDYIPRVPKAADELSQPIHPKTIDIGVESAQKGKRLASAQMGGARKAVGETKDVAVSGDGVTKASAAAAASTSFEADSIPSSPARARMVACNSPAAALSPRVESRQQSLKAAPSTVHDRLSKLVGNLYAVLVDLPGVENMPQNLRHTVWPGDCGRAITALKAARKRISGICASFKVPGATNGGGSTSVGNLPFSSEIIVRGSNFTRVQRITEIIAAVAKSIQKPAPKAAKDLEGVAGDLDGMLKSVRGGQAL